MRDHEIDEAAVHHLDDAAAEPGRRHRARRSVRPMVVSFSGASILSGEDLARLRQPSGVECLESLVDQVF